jgi:signal transduction histidine kinase
MDLEDVMISSPRLNDTFPGGCSLEPSVKIGAKALTGDELGGLIPASAPTHVPIGMDTLSEERLAERKRIAQELHDTLLQGFLAASLHLHAAVDRLAEDCPERNRFNDITRMIDRVLEEGRCAVQGLRVPGAAITSLREAFARLPDDSGFASAAGYRVVVLGRETQLRPGLLDEVYRIGREAIVNAWRHSQAKHIEAELEYRPCGLRVAVRDNGRGIVPQNLESARDRHWGIQGMRERAERIGARLRLWSRVQLGTEVELFIPGAIAFEAADGQITN